MTEGMRDFLRAWERWHIEPEEYRELDAERVLVLSRVEGRGQSSGLEIKHDRAAVFHISGDKVTGWVVYWDRERAFADLGLKE